MSNGNVPSVAWHVGSQLTTSLGSPSLTRLAARRGRALTSAPSNGADSRSHYEQSASCWAPVNKPIRPDERTAPPYPDTRAVSRPSSMGTCKAAVVMPGRDGAGTTSCRPARQVWRRADRCSRARALAHTRITDARCRYTQNTSCWTLAHQSDTSGRTHGFGHVCRHLTNPVQCESLQASSPRAPDKRLRVCTDLRPQLP